MEGEKRCKKGLWTEEEDKILIEYIRAHGKGKWNHLAKMTGVKRSGKSCRLRWTNYLSPSIKHGNFSEEEEDLIIRLHNLLGNRWSLIAGRVPGRTDNQVKNERARFVKLGVRTFLDEHELSPIMKLKARDKHEPSPNEPGEQTSRAQTEHCSCSFGSFAALNLYRIENECRLMTLYLIVENICSVYTIENETLVVYKTENTP